MTHTAICEWCGEEYEESADEAMECPVRECVGCWCSQDDRDRSPAANAAVPAERVAPVESIKIGSRVRIRNSGLPADEVSGVVYGYAADLEWYLVLFEQGPPWRGLYARSELVLA